MVSRTQQLRPEIDRIQPVRDAPNWTENLLFTMHDSAAGLAAWAHWSRVPARPTIWEGILALYLPDGELLLHRSFGSGSGPGAGAGPRPDAASSGPLTYRCIAPMRQWAVHFDGMARRTSTAEVTAGPLADGPWEPVRFEAHFEGISAAWSARGLDDQEWADQHLEQPGRITGTTLIRGRRISFDTAGFRDHSYGPRDYSAILGDAWLSGVFPSGRTVLAVVVWGHAEGAPPYVVGLVDDSGRHPVTDLRLPRLGGLDGAPAEFTAQVVTPAATSRIEVALTHLTTYTMDEPVGMTLGVRPVPDALIAAEGPARLRWDGEETDGWIERILRRNQLAPGG
jgi:hypothetical protein